jgi:alpha-L-rhamnosidase
MKIFFLPRALRIACLTLIGVFVGASSSKAEVDSEGVKVVDLRCEYLKDPLGIDVLAPRLSWRIEAPGKTGVMQKSYRVQVASSRELLAQGKADLWDSGVVPSDKSVHVEYKGKELTSRMVCYWKVGVTTTAAKGKSSSATWSPPAFWSMGLLKPSDWGGKWIGWEKGEVMDPIWHSKWIWYPEGEPAKAAAVGECFFRKVWELPVSDVMARTTCRIAADDTFVLWVNGQEVGKGGGQVTSTFDITQWLRPGPNVIAIQAANLEGSRKSAGLVAAFSVDSQSAPVEVLRTDANWRVSRREINGWKEKDFDDTSWQRALEISPFYNAPWGWLDTNHRVLAGRLLRREFTTTRQLARATAFISGLGLSDLHINGEKISDHVLSPALSDYTKRAFYVTHDVTKQIRNGANAIGVMLGNGRYFSLRNGSKSSYPRMMFQLVLEYTDGSSESIVSDETWKITDQGPILANNEYDGETYDARREQAGWNLPGFDDKSWDPVQLVKPASPILEAQKIEPIRVTESIKPVAVTEPKPGVYVFDMGQNMVGWCRLAVSGPAGSTITLRHGEKLLADGTLDTANLRTARATDRYTLKGEGTEIWEPRFIYHGFRFVEINGWPGAEAPTLTAIEGKVVHDDIARSGAFECSNELLNQIYRNYVWGIRGNYRSMPTDCPQRDERLGWLGDRNVGSLSETYLFDISKLYPKWMQDVADSMRPNGVVCDLAPTYSYPYSDGVVWPSSFVIIPHYLHRQYGDDLLLEKHYEAMKKWIDHTAGYISDGVIQKNMYGDWCVPPESPKLIHSADPMRQTDGGLLSTAYYYHAITLMEATARRLGKQDDATRFAETAQSLKSGFNKKFLRPAEGYYGNGSQTACVLPLAFGMVPDDMKPRVFARLVDKIENESAGHLGTGLLGSQYLMHVLSDNGRPDLAYRIAANKTYPSLGYMVLNGATTLWELWNGDVAPSEMNSQNHVMLIGDLNIWLTEYLVGIRPEVPGFKKIIIKPSMVGDLSWVKGHYDSIHGRIISEWQRKDGKVHMQVGIPANTTATVYVPARDAGEVNESGKPALSSPGCKFLRMESGYAVFEIGSGRFSFDSKSENGPAADRSTN